MAVSMLTGSQSPKAIAALEAIVDGSVLVVPALLEGGSRYAFEKPNTQATIDGDGYRLSGKKILVTGGDAADEFIVTASLDGRPALFLVSAGDDNLIRTTYRQLDGSWAADIALDGVRVEGDALVGGIEALTRGLDSGAIGVAALEVGVLDRVLEVTSDYIHIRKQFGQPLASFQALQHIMSDLFINTEMARSSVHSGLAGTLRSAEERQKAISAARVRCDRAALTVGNMGIYLHGGMGMTMEYPVGHHYRRLVQLTRAFGDTEYHISRYEGLAFADN
ncbi:acyl-CoA dehydrogenase [Novosphingobium sp. G106]|uniref:acyl-CoA dehydrogenase n=1 Tax=Novosphingobium sp. G106 TaxID=2849500 RepID=UPI001C2DEB58|nr:acyl-CoA dehydrogenase [Novosphingobium sp. G106]MBV1688890.1 acyl-CoA dehydrogenase [Novosphingobium sp. G106]